MRAGLSTIQQTLTPEAASVLNNSIAEASRRNHGQTTPLHVAATLLASPSGFLRQACIRSHPNSSHPLQCRALELCFSVALERLPTAQQNNANNPSEPPISNALMAALKRAQAHQRRGCPEQQQQPLLAVKVELEQLIISILDDPSVSRVMREASFSSPAVKAAIENSLNNSQSNIPPQPSNGLGFPPVPAVAAAAANRSLYLNPRLQQSAAVASGQQRSDDMKRVMDILTHAKKRNPVLVGESEPAQVMAEIVKRIERKEVGDGLLKNVEVIRIDKEKIKELEGIIETRIGNSKSCNGVILDLGDLKWLVEQNVNNLGAAETGRAAVAEMKKLLERFGGRLWVIGTATCETYLRCQVYYPSMESDWDLQAVSVAARAPPSGMFPRLGNAGILSNSVESLSPLKSFPAASTAPYRRLCDKVDLTPKQTTCCPQCQRNYEQELSRLRTSSPQVKPEAAQLQQLPQWLQNAKSSDGDVKTVDPLSPTRIQDLQRKWNEMCLRLHPSYHRQPSLGSERIVPTPISLTSLHNPNLLLRQPLQPKLQPNRKLSDSAHLNSNPPGSRTTGQASSPPGSPVRTELALGRPKVVESGSERVQDERVKDLLSCISSEKNNKTHVLETNKLGNALDVDLFKKLLKGLSEKVWWQHDAASAVAATVSQCKMGNGKQRGVLSKGDVWLLFSGPDKVGKKKMASTLSELVYGASPITINLGSRRDGAETDLSFRGKTALDRIAETVRRSPFSVIVLEDIHEADILLRGSIKNAMERGRLSDSHGREISLGNVIFILTANWSITNNKTDEFGLDERKLRDLASGSWELKLSLHEKTAKRRPSWLYNEDERSARPRKETGSGLSFDLNEAADVDDKADGSLNSSDLTIDHDQEEHGAGNRLSLQSIPYAFHELVGCLDDAIVFKQLDFSPIRKIISNSLSKRFSNIIGDSLSLEIPDDTLEKIAGGVWLGQKGLEEWIEGVVVPSIHQLKSRLSSKTFEENMVARLELDGNSDDRGPGNLLPSGIRLMLD